MSACLTDAEWKVSSLDGQSLIEGGGVEVHRGPLLFALRPASTDVGKLIHQQDGFPPIRHHTITIAENASWNYVRRVGSLDVLFLRLLVVVLLH